MSKFQELNRFNKQKIEQAHKKEVMFVDFHDASAGAGGPMMAAAAHTFGPGHVPVRVDKLTVVYISR